MKKPTKLGLALATAAAVSFAAGCHKTTGHNDAGATAKTHHKMNNCNAKGREACKGNRGKKANKCSHGNKCKS